VCGGGRFGFRMVVVISQSKLSIAKKKALENIYALRCMKISSTN
jgi:hypothetical protein